MAVYIVLHSSAVSAGDAPTHLNQKKVGSYTSIIQLYTKSEVLEWPLKKKVFMKVQKTFIIDNKNIQQ